MRPNRESYINGVDTLIDRYGHIIWQHFLDQIKNSVRYGEEEEAFAGLIYQLDIKQAVIDPDSLEIMAELIQSHRMDAHEINAYNELARRSVNRVSDGHIRPRHNRVIGGPTAEHRFPDGWDDEYIKAAIKQVANDKRLKVLEESGENHPRGRDTYAGVIDGLMIKVIVEREGGSHVHTAYPLYGD